MSLVRRLFSIFVLLATSPLLQAHQVASVELEFIEDEGRVRLQGEMDIAYMLPETRNIPGGLPLKRSVVENSSPEEFARICRETDARLHQLIRFSYAGKDVPWQVEFPDFKKPTFSLPPEEGDVALITTRLLLPPVTGPGEMRIHWAGEQETELIILFETGDAPRVISTLPGGSLMLFKRADEGVAAPVETPVTGGWVQSGFRHVLPLGLDHMLFILGLFLLVPKWKPLLGQSLLFTLAHSLTLALSVFQVVKVPSLWAEVLIAASIAWIGIENLFSQKLGRQRLVLVFCFGLLHGLGFASVLAEKLGDFPRNQLLGPLLGFNVGVELAQITVLTAAFSVLWPLRKYTRTIQLGGSICVALAGLSWVVERLS
jgi:HupE / UreJ protein